MGGRRSPALVVLALASACGRSPLLLVDVDELDEPIDVDAPAPNCEQVDVLFVIDDSPSMGDNQRKLADNYDVFVDGITALVQSSASVHIGVVTTEAYPHNVEGCRDLGDLIVQTGGHGSSDESCGPYAAGTNYITRADEIDASFACAARVGTTGAVFEQPMRAALQAIGGGEEPAGECNDGFIRDDAMLVIVFVTDEDGELDPEETYEALVAARRGNPNGIVVVTLANLPGGECSLGNHAEVGFQIAALTELFPFGFLGSVCAADYTDVFRQAVDVVADACARG